MHSPSAIGIALLFAMAAQAQWLNYPDARTPRTKDRKPNLTAPAPRATNGKPDLSGVWHAEPPTGAEQKQLFGDLAGAPVQADLQFVSMYALNIFSGVKAEDQPVRPETRRILEQRAQTAGKDIPTSHCLPGGLPFAMLIAPFKIVQTPVEIVMLLEDNNPPRQIYLDGRPLPKDPEPSWLGYSTAKWQGDTLVVESIGFNDRSWLDGAGHPRSESMRITERFRRSDFGHMEVEIILDDPKYYTSPFSLKAAFKLIPDSDVLESICAENEKDRSHLDR